MKRRSRKTRKGRRQPRKVVKCGAICSGAEEMGSVQGNRDENLKKLKEEEMRLRAKEEENLRRLKEDEERHRAKEVEKRGRKGEDLVAKLKGNRLRLCAEENQMRWKEEGRLQRLREDEERHWAKEAEKCGGAEDGVRPSKEKRSRKERRQRSSDGVVRVECKPIFLWVKQVGTKIVEVICDDYEPKNRIKLKKTAEGCWSSTLVTDTRLIPPVAEFLVSEEITQNDSRQHSKDEEADDKNEDVAVDMGDNEDEKEVVKPSAEPEVLEEMVVDRIHEEIDKIVANISDDGNAVDCMQEEIAKIVDGIPDSLELTTQESEKEASEACVKTSGKEEESEKEVSEIARDESAVCVKIEIPEAEDLSLQKNVQEIVQKKLSSTISMEVISVKNSESISESRDINANIENEVNMNIVKSEKSEEMEVMEKPAELKPIAVKMLETPRVLSAPLCQSMLLSYKKHDRKTHRSTPFHDFKSSPEKEVSKREVTFDGGEQLKSLLTSSRTPDCCFSKRKLSLGGVEGTPQKNARLINLLRGNDNRKREDPMEQLQSVLSNPHYAVPDPLLVPKNRLQALVKNPGKEIPRLIGDNAYARAVVPDPDLLVVSLSHLRNLLMNPMTEEELKSYYKRADMLKSTYYNEYSKSAFGYLPPYGSKNTVAENPELSSLLKSTHRQSPMDIGCSGVPSQSYWDPNIYHNSLELWKEMEYRRMKGVYPFDPFVNYDRIAADYANYYNAYAAAPHSYHHQELYQGDARDYAKKGFTTKEPEIMSSTSGTFVKSEPSVPPPPPKVKREPPSTDSKPAISPAKPRIQVKKDLGKLPESREDIHPQLWHPLFNSVRSRNFNQPTQWHWTTPVTRT